MSKVPSNPRRIVVMDEDGRSRALMNGPSPDVLTDPARPGFSSALMWASDQAPVILTEGIYKASMPHTLEPPPRGSICRVVTFPPDATYVWGIDEDKVRAHFEAMGAPGASTYSESAAHPYMQKTETLDFCLVLHGGITLILDTEEVHLEAGDTVIQRGTNHAWSNRSKEPCVVLISSHDARSPDAG
jgi:mannose-6-phosphate isomerase-like protein (cupin superfamily)